MDTQFHTLPPRKRLSLRQKQRNSVDYTLPTKQRSQSRRPKITAVAEAVTYPLPTKKRVRAFQLEYVDYSICEGFDDVGDYSLPAKKRMDSRVVVCDVDVDLDADAGVVSVHNRKRVCAFKPDFVFDLNVEYKPSLNEDCKLESDFGSVAIGSREVKEESRMMNVGCDSDDKIGSNCADLDIADEFGGGGGVTESNKTGEVVDALGREEERLVECERFEIVGNFDNAEVTVNESSEMVEEIENADEIDRREVNINKEEESGSVDKFNDGADGCGNDGEIDACVDFAFDSYGGKSISDNANAFNGVLDGCCNEVAIDACVECATDGNGDKLVTGNGEVLENADALNEAYVGNNVNGVAKGCCNREKTFACVDVVKDGNGEFDNTLTSTHILGGDIGGSEAEYLKEDSSTDAAIECDSESEDGVICEICQSTDGDPSDPIVFCDRCDLTAHASCYGNPLAKGIPEGDWFCDKCIFQAKNPLNPISCCLCPSTGGVLKPTNDGRWAHILCTVFVPEAFFLDPEGREGIDVSNISAKRFKKKCYICEKMQGCVIDCSESKCSLSFHVTCGLENDLCIEYREGNMKKEAIVAGFCHDHTKLWKKQQQTGKFKIVARKSHDL